jgi:hypothetical protein
MFMLADRTPSWSFLTNHAQVLLCIAQDPGIRLREIGEAVGITERATAVATTTGSSPTCPSPTRSPASRGSATSWPSSPDGATTYLGASASVGETAIARLVDPSSFRATEAAEHWKD